MFLPRENSAISRIILSNDDGKVFWARRVGQNAWQFPQGGIDSAESPEQAMYRELAEETGLSANDVEVLGCTREWLKYRLPKRYVRRNQQPICVGQKQIWYMLRMTGSESSVDLSSGEVELLYTHAGDIALKGPNDIVFDAHGGFWFTDLGKLRHNEQDRGRVERARGARRSIPSCECACAESSSACSRSLQSPSSTSPTRKRRRWRWPTWWW